MYKKGQRFRITEKWRNYRIANYNDKTWQVGDIVTVKDVADNGDVLIEGDGWFVWAGYMSYMEPVQENELQQAVDELAETPAFDPIEQGFMRFFIHHYTENPAMTLEELNQAWYALFRDKS